MLKGLILLLLTGFLSSSMARKTLDSANLAPIEYLKKDSSNNLVQENARKFSDKKTARKHKKIIRKEFNKEHPKSSRQILIVYILPTLSAIALALSQCNK